MAQIRKKINALEKLVSVQNSSDREIITKLVSDLRGLQDDYNDKLKASIHLQNDAGMIPTGDTACAYRSYQIGIELALGSPMPMSLINEATGGHIKNNNLSMGTGKEYNVENGYNVMNDTLSRLGRSDLEVKDGIQQEAYGYFSKSMGISVNDYSYHQMFIMGVIFSCLIQ